MYVTYALARVLITCLAMLRKFYGARHVPQGAEISKKHGAGFIMDGSPSFVLGPIGCEYVQGRGPGLKAKPTAGRGARRATPPLPPQKRAPRRAPIL